MDDKPDLDVAAVHYANACALLTDNTIVPITHWIDMEAESTKLYPGEPLPQEAVAIVCGNDTVGYFAVDLDNYEPRELH